MPILFVEKVKKVGELLWKFTDSAVQFHVNFFPVGLDNAIRI